MLVEVGEASRRAEFRCGHADSWYRPLLLGVLTNASSEDRGLLVLLLVLLLALVLCLGRRASNQNESQLIELVDLG